MSRREKIIERLLSKPKDFTYPELVTLLNILGYKEMKTSRSGGSSRAFVSITKHIIRLHKPHPQNELKLYQIDYIIQELRKENLI